MKDVWDVLRQKEEDLERVGREIQALLTVIPLLADDQPIPEDVMHLLDLTSSATVVKPSNNGMATLGPYYPFVSRREPTNRLRAFLGGLASNRP